VNLQNDATGNRPTMSRFVLCKQDSNEISTLHLCFRDPSGCKKTVLITHPSKFIVTSKVGYIACGKKTKISRRGTMKNLLLDSGETNRGFGSATVTTL